MEAKRLEEEAAAEAERLRLEQEEADRLAAEAAAEADAKSGKKGRKKAQVNGHPNPAVDGLISDSRRGSYDGSRRGSSGSVILGESRASTPPNFRVCAQLNALRETLQNLPYFLYVGTI